jgi:hypothetical protein
MSNAVFWVYRYFRKKVLSFVNSTVLGMFYMYLDMIPHILLLFFQSFLGVGFRVFWEVGFWVEGFLEVGFWV